MVKKWKQKSMKECDKRNSHISSNTTKVCNCIFPTLLVPEESQNSQKKIYFKPH